MAGSHIAMYVYLLIVAAVIVALALLINKLIKKNNSKD